MILDCERYVGPCKCGLTHEMETKKVVVEYNAIANFQQYMADVGLAGKKTVVVTDEIIYERVILTNGKKIEGDNITTVVLPAKGLRAEDILIEDFMSKLDKDVECIVAFGGGTIMDFGRYPGYKLGIPFVAVPTLASSDGFTASICSAILNGQKKSVKMCAPILVVCDLDIVKGAPLRLVASGVNDILAKYISLVDWKIACMVTDERYCDMVAGLAQDALDIMRPAADKMAATGEIDHEAMAMAQMISGLTMQLWVDSRAASGAEHLMAHLVEMAPPRFEGAEGIHGECVGVGTFACVKEYHRLGKLQPRAKKYEPLSKSWIDEKFGERLADGIIKENANDVLATVDPQEVVDKWADIQAIIDTIPPVEEMEALYKGVGAKYLPEHVGIKPELADEMLEISAAIRNRLTLIRMRRILEF